METGKGSTLMYLHLKKGGEDTRVSCPSLAIVGVGMKHFDAGL